MSFPFFAPSVPPPTNASAGAVATWAHDNLRRLSLMLNGPIAPVELVTANPPATIPTRGRIIFNETDGEYYTDTGTVIAPLVEALDLTGTITTTDLADGSVTTVKLGDAAVTTAKLGNGAVTSVNIGDGQVIETKLGAASVTEVKLGAASVTTTKLADGALTVAKFANGLRPVEVVSSLPAAGTAGRTVFLTTDNKIYRDTGAAWTVETAATDIVGQLVAGQIAAGQIAASHIVAGTITSAQIATGTIVAANIASGTITATQIAAATITGDRIAANTIQANNIAALTITANEIAALTITGAKIAAGTISANKLIINGGVGSALNPDPNCIDPGSWSDTGNYTFTTVSDGVVGPNVIRNSAGNSVAALQGSSPIDPSKKYRVRARIRRNSAADGVFYLRLWQLDATDTLVAYDIGFEGQSANTAWTTYTSAIITPHASAIRAHVAMWLAYTSSAGYMEAQDVRLEEVLPDTLIQDGAITTNKMTANSINGDRITAGTLDASKIVAGSITTDRMTANTINGDRIAAGTLDAAKIVAGSITTDRMTANTINGDRITAGTLDAAKITAGSITTDRMTANSINGDRIAAGTLDAAKIVANSITGDHITGTTLSAIYADLGTINAGLLQNAESSPTAAIRLNSGYTLPGTATSYLDLAASGSNPFLAHGVLRLHANGSAELSTITLSATFGSGIGSIKPFSNIVPGLAENHNVELGVSDSSTRTAYRAVNDVHNAVRSLQMFVNDAVKLRVNTADIQMYVSLVLNSNNLTGVGTFEATSVSGGSFILNGATVDLGDADSGGSGYRVLRVPN